MKLTFVLKGGSGSGNHGHHGRPGHQGGSAPDAGGPDADKALTDIIYGDTSTVEERDAAGKKLGALRRREQDVAKFAGKTTEQLWDDWKNAADGSQAQHVITAEINRRWDEDHPKVPKAAPDIKAFADRKITEDNLTDTASEIMRMAVDEFSMPEGGWSASAWKKTVNPFINKIKKTLVFTADTAQHFDDAIGSEYDSLV